MSHNVTLMPFSEVYACVLGAGVGCAIGSLARCKVTLMMSFVCFALARYLGKQGALKSTTSMWVTLALGLSGTYTIKAVSSSALRLVSVVTSAVTKRLQ